MTVEVAHTRCCPDCGTAITSDGDSKGLCPSCLMELALDSPTLLAEVLEPSEAPTVGYVDEGLVEGQVQGERYRIRSRLGRGGMGEVWRAYDLKLRQDVAIKSLRRELLEDPRALETLRQEVRSAREVISPNVCRVFDLQELDGQELVSMEYIDGVTLHDVLVQRSPLELDEAREIASQFLAGLEAIHDADLVHQDIKPENIMVTRTGRVVVMDFGLAKGLQARGLQTKGQAKEHQNGSGQIAGTPAYMSPEQSQGGDQDARSDVYSAGVVLAEMVAPSGIRTFEKRKRIWEGIHQTTPEIAETPWSRVISKALDTDPGGRFDSAAQLARALEEVTLRAVGDESARPYPGLSAFQLEDANYFFGRELEVEALWKKLRRPHLLAVIGPSGAGKSSFLRAGLLPTLTDGWRAIVATPGNRPFANLARALASELTDSADHIDRLLRFEESNVAVDLISEWRSQHERTLIIFDQFEELFTQNPDEVQQRFAELLGRLPLEADLHVLLAMRDDFLMNCHRFEALRPVFSELSPLDPPLGAALRRALVQPALKCGYRFEDESLVEAMLGEVEGERGSLPMVAFAAAKLWESRDRDSGLLTRKAYQAIGGVGGALAQHAEATLEQIGKENVPIVRELFRNLVTAQGTRAARDRDELLSVFERGHDPKGDMYSLRVPLDGDEARGHDPAQGHDPKIRGHDPELLRSSGHVPLRDRVPFRAGHVPLRDRVPFRAGHVPVAATVLDALIDSRLLTSFEVPATDDEGSAHHRIEIIHESLLTAWPRLVRWQTQDAEGAQLRDELRHQANLWSEKGRPNDLLWTGTSYKEYELWRERYPGGLTATEESFARAMTAHAERRKRRRRLAVSAVTLVALVVAVVMGGLWLRSQKAEREARQEALRAEAAKLLAFAELRIETDPTEALAFTMASLELADTEESRVFVMKTLGSGPPVLVLDPKRNRMMVPAFSPDGRWLSLAGHGREEVLVWHQDGSGPVILGGHPPSPQGAIRTGWTSENELVTGHGTEGRARIWSFPGGQLVREIDLGGPAWWQVGSHHLLAEFNDTDVETGHGLYHLRRWRLPEGEAEKLGTVDRTAIAPGFFWSFFDPSGRGWFYGKDKEIFYRPLPVREGVPDRLVGSHENRVEFAGFPTDLDRVWTRDASTGELRLWSLSASSAEPLRVVARPAGLPERTGVQTGLDGRWLHDASLIEGDAARDGKALLWDSSSLPGVAPRELKRSNSWYFSQLALHPDGDWIVASTNDNSELSFWPLRASLPAVVNGYDTRWLRSVVFAPDGKWLATYWGQDKLRLWPLPGSGSREVRELEIEAHGRIGLAIDPAGERLFVAGMGTTLFVVPLDGGEPRRLEGFLQNTQIQQGAFSPSGRLAAAASGWVSKERKLRVWDLEKVEVKTFELPQAANESAGEDGSSGGADSKNLVQNLAFTDESTLLTAGGAGVLRWDLEAGTYEQIVSVKPGQVAQLWLSGDRRQLITVVRDLAGECGPLVLHDLLSGQSRELTTFITCRGFPWQVQLAFDDTFSVMAIGRTDGTLWVGRVGGGSPHLLTGHHGPLANAGLAISPDGRWIASSGQDKTLRLWPMPDLDKPPLHTLPRDELIAKLRSLTNLRAIRDAESSTGWSIDIGPFPGWEEVPTW